MVWNNEAIPWLVFSGLWLLVALALWPGGPVRRRPERMEWVILAVVVLSLGAVVVTAVQGNLLAFVVRAVIAAVLITVCVQLWRRRQ